MDRKFDRYERQYRLKNKTKKKQKNFSLHVAVEELEDNIFVNFTCGTFEGQQLGKLLIFSFGTCYPNTIVTKYHAGATSILITKL